jgi:hypothetical protein
MLASCEVPVGNDERGAAVQVGQEPRSDGSLSLICGAVGAEHVEGRGVGPALGGEVPVMRKSA